MISLEDRAAPLVGAAAIVPPKVKPEPAKIEEKNEDAKVPSKVEVKPEAKVAAPPKPVELSQILNENNKFS